MSEMTLNKKTPLEDIRWFGIKLGHTTKIILFYFSILGLANSTTLWLYLYNICVIGRVYGYISEYVIRNVISLIIDVIIANIYIYTLIICVISKKYNRELKNETYIYEDVKWFGFRLSQTSALLLFCLALIGTIPTLKYTYNIIAELINPLAPLVIITLTSYIHFLLIDSFSLFIYLFSMIKYGQLRRKIHK